MSEIRIGNLLEASEEHEAETIFTYISKVLLSYGITIVKR